MKILLLGIILTQVSFSTTLSEFIGSEKIEKNIENQKKYFISFLDDAPWEGSYWPNRAASIAYRHKDNDSLKFYSNMIKGVRPNLRKLKRKINKSTENFKALEQKDIDKFSASEKYDLLLEDSNFSFTHNLLEKIEENHKRWRKTTWWTGICHGWAPAAIKYHEPKESVSFQNSYGHKITFTPENIKALASFFVSNSVTDKRPTFLGNRCNLKKPKQNKRDHSVLSLTNYSRSKDECSDIEAADFHNILINKIGIKKESFIVDIDYNAPVNNHPIAGYKMQIIDKSKSTLSFHTQVYYTNWTRPGLTRSHLPQDEQFLIKDYYYDLFIDANSNIVSSKWNNKKNKVWAPDFMWLYPKDTSFKEYYSDLTKDLEFNIEAPVSNQLKKEAIKSSSNKILLNYLNRLKSRKSKKLKIYKEANRYAADNKIKLIETRKVFEPKLDQENVKTKQAHPQLIKLVLDQLIKEKH